MNRKGIPKLMVPECQFSPETNSPARFGSLPSMSSPIEKRKRNRPKPMLGLKVDMPVPKQDETPALDITQYTMKIDDADIETREELGMGSTGSVFLVYHKPTKTVLAKKIIHSIQPARRANIQNELKLLNQCRSPFVVSFYGAKIDDGDLNIYLEYMDVGSLEKILKLAGKLNEDVLTKISVSVLKGLVYLYEKHKVMHRDIKPSNILVNSKGQIKICDFGESRETGIESVANTFVGTGYYMSPERIQGGNKYSYNADTWSLGLSILELALGYYPFSTKKEQGEMSPPLSEFELLSSIVKDSPPTLCESSFSPTFRSFIHDCLIKDPSKRPSPKDLVIKHPIIQNEGEIQVNMVKWATSFLKPNLSQQQLNRWSVTQEYKRKSYLDKRQSKFRPVGHDSKVDGVSDIFKALSVKQQ